MNKYKDVFEGLVAEIKETPNTNFLATMKIKWGKSDEWNKNKRYYPDLVAGSAIEDFDKASKKNVGVVGQLDHPTSGGTLLSNASHLVSGVWKDKNKVWWADCKILNTSKGKDLMTVLKTGTTIGASLRGFGETDKDGKVKAGLKISAIDFVHSPSFGASATVDQSSVFESYVPENANAIEDEWSEENIQDLSSAMDGLSDATIKMVQEKLEKSEGIVMTESRIKALVIWIKHHKSNPNILPFDEWFIAQQKKLGVQNSICQVERNDILSRQSNVRNEKRLAIGNDKRRLEKRQNDINEAISGSRYDSLTISRLYTEACLAGFTGSKSDWIKEFGK